MKTYYCQINFDVTAKNQKDAERISEEARQAVFALPGVDYAGGETPEEDCQ